MRMDFGADTDGSRALPDGVRGISARDQFCSMASGVISMVAENCRPSSFRHFVEHLVCSTPGTVAMDLNPGLGMGSGSGLDLIRFSLF